MAKYIIDDKNEVRDLLVNAWGDDVAGKVFAEIDKVHTEPMAVSDYMDKCTACGGDWGNMLLSGVKVLFPDVYNAVPDKLGKDGFDAFFNVCRLLQLLKIYSTKED